MQTLQADYFAVYRSLKLARDASGVRVLRIHNNREPLIFTAPDPTQFVNAFYRITQARENKIVILTGAGGDRVQEKEKDEAEVSPTTRLSDEARERIRRSLTNNT